MPPPFTLPGAYARIPLGNGGAAINLFGRGWLDAGVRCGAAMSEGPALTAHCEMTGPRLMGGDPWFAATAAPLVGVDVTDPGGVIATRLGVEHTVMLNSHVVPVPLMPRVAYGVSLGGGSAVPFVSAGVEMPLAANPDGAFTLGLGYRYDERTGHGAELSFGFRFGELHGRGLSGTLFTPGR